MPTERPSRRPREEARRAWMHAPTRPPTLLPQAQQDPGPLRPLARNMQLPLALDPSDEDAKFAPVDETPVPGSERIATPLPDARQVSKSILDVPLLEGLQKAFDKLKTGLVRVDSKARLRGKALDAWNGADTRTKMVVGAVAAVAVAMLAWKMAVLFAAAMVVGAVLVR